MKKKKAPEPPRLHSKLSISPTIPHFKLDWKLMITGRNIYAVHF